MKAGIARDRRDARRLQSLQATADRLLRVAALAEVARMPQGETRFLRELAADYQARAAHCEKVADAAA